MPGPFATWGWGAKAGLFYAGTNLLCNIWCWSRLSDTKDRTFGEIDLLFDNKVPARKFKYTKVDREFCGAGPVFGLRCGLTRGCRIRRR
ncbi:hypothetical protein IMZ48_37660 [Candidatus Bathyarchaeota archaeon]|nr:hypothetical protein [Candidatus Bathyarchaeota archaeon]